MLASYAPVEECVNNLQKYPLVWLLRSSSSSQIEMQLYYLKKVLLLTSVDIIRTVAMPLPSVRLTPGFPERSATTSFQIPGEYWGV